MACGCVVFSSLNHALADHGVPGRTLHQIGCGRLGFDLERIAAAVRTPLQWRPSSDQLDLLLDHCSEANLLVGWHQALGQLDAMEAVSGPDLVSPSTWQLRLDQGIQRLRRVVDRFPGWLNGT